MEKNNECLCKCNGYDGKVYITRHEYENDGSKTSFNGTIEQKNSYVLRSNTRLRLNHASHSFSFKTSSAI